MPTDPMRPATPSDPPRARAANLLGAVALEAARAQEAAGREVLGHGGTDSAALVVLAASPGRTVEQLRRPLGLSQPGATRLVDRLVSAGWVVRGGPGGRQGLELRLTPAGRRVLDELLAARRRALTGLREPLEPAEIERLADLLSRVLAARTASRADLERICRLCERPACARCPVGAALDALIAAGAAD
jgi:MarR family transcriptional regulator, negative regulator of the multidrug operon emrRAB